VDHVLVAQLREALKKDPPRHWGSCGLHALIDAPAVGFELLVLRASLAQNLAMYRPREPLGKRGVSNRLGIGPNESS
jgi:hypothetical protein